MCASIMILFVAVVGFAMWKKRGIPDSVSEIGYVIPSWAFTAWITLLGMLAMPMMMEVLTDSYQVVGFFAIVGLLCVASSPFYRTEEKALHYIGGGICALCATIVTMMVAKELLLCWLGYLMVMTVVRWKCWCFFAEVFVIVLLLISLCYKVS